MSETAKTEIENAREESGHARAQFRNFKEGTKEDWQIIGREYVKFSSQLVDRVLDHLNLLKGDCGGFPVDRYEHSLQTATRAYEGGEDEEYVICALLHDIGDTLGSHNHAEVAAAILKPFISEANFWMVEKHAVFQGHDFFHHIGLDRNMRDQYKEHPHYERTARFCNKYDGAAFDPDYESKPIEFFLPMIKKVMSAPKNSIYNKSALTESDSEAS